MNNLRRNFKSFKMDDFHPICTLYIITKMRKREHRLSKTNIMGIKDYITLQVDGGGVKLPPLSDKKSKGNRILLVLNIGY